MAITMTSGAVALHFHGFLPSTKSLVARNITSVRGGGGKCTCSVAEKAKKMASTKDGQRGLMKIGSSVCSLLLQMRRSISPLEILKPPDTNTASWPLLAEIAVDQAVTSCRFFTLIAVLGSLVGSVLCFVEGCFLVMESYIEDFHIGGQSLVHGRVGHLVIEAIDMFIVGTAMLNFGLGLYSMFIGFRRVGGCAAHGSKAPLLFQYPKMLSAGSRMSSISQAKSRFGHALLMLLQVGIVEKFKSVPLATGVDLACFAGALFFSSASMFLLSRLRCHSDEELPQTKAHC